MTERKTAEYSKESLDFFRLFIKARRELCDSSPTETYSLEEAIRKAFDALQPSRSSATAEEIIESILESLGDPINIHNHAFEIRPYTVDHKTEWWIFHKEVASGEPLAQWLDKFAALHAQKIADKMVSEKLREELIKYEIHWNFVLRDNAEKVVDEYLKSRESHDNIR